MLTIILTHSNNSTLIHAGHSVFSIRYLVSIRLSYTMHACTHIEKAKTEVAIFNSMQIHMFIINICPLGKQNIIEHST